MIAGDIRHVVVFKSNTPSTLGAGAADSYATVVTTRGSLKKLNGSRSLSFGELVESGSHEMYVHYQSTLNTNLRMDMKVYVGSRVFTIGSWEKVGERNFFFRFILNEEKN